MVALTSADLKSESLFSCLSIDQLEQLLSGHRETTLEVGQIVLTEQDWDDSIYFLRSGLAKVRTYSADGEEVLCAYLDRAMYLGRWQWLSSISLCRRRLSHSTTFG